MPLAGVGSSSLPSQLPQHMGRSPLFPRRNRSTSALRQTLQVCPASSSAHGPTWRCRSHECRFLRATIVTTQVEHTRLPVPVCYRVRRNFFHGLLFGHPNLGCQVTSEDRRGGHCGRVRKAGRHYFGLPPSPPRLSYTTDVHRIFQT